MQFEEVARNRVWKMGANLQFSEGEIMVGLSAGMARSCGALLEELQQIWEEIGESTADKECMQQEIERECLEIYQRKVEEAGKTKAQLHQSVATKEAEVATLMASLGEHRFQSTKDKKSAPLKEQLALVTPMLENLRRKKQERIKSFSDVRLQIEKMSAEIREHDAVISPVIVDDYDLSTRKLEEYQAQLRALHKDKSDRLQKVLEYVNEVHCLCGVLGSDFRKTVDEVHPSLHETAPGETTSISNRTLEGLAQVILKLKTEKKIQLDRLRQTVESLFELWKLMDSSEEDRKHFDRLARIIVLPEQEITQVGLLSSETIEQTEGEVSRLTQLKASRMKQLVLYRRLELEEECRRTHIEPDASTTTEKITALIDSDLVDVSELVASIEAQILKVKQESMSRKEIVDRFSKWIAACEEEDWLEQYNQDGTRYNAGRGGHINLQRAEKARITVSKIPAMVDVLVSKTFVWEDERNVPFLYDGVRLVSILEDYMHTRRQKEEDKRRFRDQKKLQSLVLAEEARPGWKAVPKRSNSLNRKASGTGFMTPAPPRRLSSTGGATPELLTPRSGSSQRNGYYMKRVSTGSNLFSLPKDDSISTLTSISGSEPESPSLS